MKLQPASAKELRHIAVGTAICTAVMVAVFGLLAAFGLVRFQYTIPLGAVCGAAIAILNFAVLCLTVQEAARADEKNAHYKVKLSYNIRLMVQAGWCVVAYLLPCFQVVAAVLPLLFPRVVIYITQAVERGRASGKTPPPTKER
ncbi:MAG: ATP synthase subunit I [Gemmiger sp.]|nr:ATP synthase subunit I [Gemmiger sp.]